jgi:signal transduction histidine kinase
VVVDRDDGIHVAYRDQKPATIDPEFVRHPDIQALIRKARNSPMFPVSAASGFAQFDGQVHVFGVSPFSPEVPPEGAKPDLARAVLIYGRRVDGGFLDAQAKNFGFTDLRLAPPTESSHKIITSPTGVALIGLTWKMRTSGTDLTTRLILPAVTVLVILGMITWYFLRRAQSMGQALSDAADVTTRQNQQLKASEAEAVRSQGLAERASTEKDQALVALRERNQDLLVARREALQASQAKTLFLAAMSHELRTPLNAIIGFSEILRDQRFGALGSDRYVDYADNIRTSGTHLLSLINDVLDISKIEAGKLTLEPEQVSVGDLCASTLRLFREQADAGRIALSSTPAEPDISLRADPRAIRQILVNLLSNALKFTRPGDEISVTAAPETRNIGGQNREIVKIAVSDTGVGIPEEFQDSVFLPFNRGAESSDQESGTGLGLALVKSLTEMHREQVELDSVEGRGTTVTIYLPRDELDADGLAN